MTTSLKPLVKYVGGKTKLAVPIVGRMPPVITGTYFEPFVGGAAVFCALFNAGRLKGRVVLSDANSDLILLYAAVRDDVDAVITELRALAAEYVQTRIDDHRDLALHTTAALYYRVRDEWNAGACTPARFVFLKQTSFNGLWRVNQAGKLNAAWGKYDAPNIIDEANLRAWNVALQGVKFAVGDFEEADTMVRAGDAVYLDPPYANTFDGYTADGFGLADHARLLTLAARWEGFGAHVVYSNSPDVEGLLRLVWPTAEVAFVETSYTINRDAAGRSGKQELIAWTL